jgi:hypothetical protein
MLRLLFAGLPNGSSFSGRPTTEHRSVDGVDASLIACDGSRLSRCNEVFAGGFDTTVDTPVALYRFGDEYMLDDCLTAMREVT